MAAARCNEIVIHTRLTENKYCTTERCDELRRPYFVASWLICINACTLHRHTPIARLYFNHYVYSSSQSLGDKTHTAFHKYLEHHLACLLLFNCSTTSLRIFLQLLSCKVESNVSVSVCFFACFDRRRNFSMLLFLLLQFHATEHMSNSIRMYKILQKKKKKPQHSESWHCSSSHHHHRSTHAHHIRTHRNKRREAK